MLLALAAGSSFALAGEPDRAHVAQLFPTIPGGREWFAQWEKARVVPADEIDPEDAASK